MYKFLFLASLFAVLALPIGCEAIEGFGPTPTLLPQVRDYDRLSAAQIAEHYQRCLKRVEPDHPDLANTSPPELAEYHGFDRSILSKLDRDCMVRYDRSFRRPTPSPTP